MQNEIKQLLEQLKYGSTFERLEAAQKLGSVKPEKNIIEALKQTRMTDSSYDIRRAAQISLRKQHAIIKLAGIDQPITEISDEDFKILMQRYNQIKSLQNTVVLGLTLIMVVTIIMLTIK